MLVILNFFAFIVNKKLGIFSKMFEEWRHRKSTVLEKVLRTEQLLTCAWNIEGQEWFYHLALEFSTIWFQNLQLANLLPCSA